MEQNPKERFEEIKKVFYQSDISTLLCKDKIEVTPKFIRDFEYLIKLVEQMGKRNNIEDQLESLVEINLEFKAVPYNFKCITKRILTEGNFIKFYDENTKQFLVINLEQIIYYTMKEIKNEENHIPHID